MLTRQQKRRLKGAVWFSLLALGLTLLIRSVVKRNSAVGHVDLYSSNDMLSQAKKQVSKRKSTNINVDIRAEDFVDLPDADVDLERLIEAGEKRIKAKEAEKAEKAEEQPKVDIQLKQALDSITEMIKDNNEKISDLQNTIERVSRRIKAQEELGVEMESLLKSRLMFIAEKQESILKQTTQITKANEVPFFKIAKFSEPPVSTVTCFGNSTVDRVCKIKNLCYDPDTDNFFIFKDPSSLEINTPKNRSYLVDSTSIDAHNRFFWDYHEVHPDQYEQRSFRLVEKPTFMISRFHVYNIMHTVHDDFIGLYILHRMFAANTDPDPSYSFTQDNNILFVDSFMNLRYDYIFQLLTKNQLQFREAFRQDQTTRMPICFRDAVVGNSKLGSWYTYGFLEPQGPIPNKTVSGLMIREVASYLIRRFHLPLWNEAAIRGIVGDLKTIIADRKKRGKRDIIHRNISDHHYITIFSRRLDRLIINEDEMAKELQKYYGLEVRYVRIEDMHLLDQISILKNTVIAIGVHGSALILSMFLPPGALLVELFPYRVPTENYTPYKTLCNLPGIRLAYRAWSNKHAENNFPHPERPANRGGIKHLPEDEQQAILDNPTVPPHLCCENPVWLFRIFQDTKVHIEELFDLIDDGIEEGAAAVNADPADWVFIRPASIENVYCKTEVNEDDPDQLDMTISWTKPWNGVKPDFYGIWVHQSFKELNTKGKETHHVFQNCTKDVDYDLWVRPYMMDQVSKEITKGAYSDKFICKCSPDSQAVRSKLEV